MNFFSATLPSIVDCQIRGTFNYFTISLCFIHARTRAPMRNMSLNCMVFVCCYGIFTNHPCGKLH